MHFKKPHVIFFVPPPPLFPQNHFIKCPFPPSLSLPLPWLYMYTSGAQCMIGFYVFFFIISFLFFLFWEGDVPLFCTLDGRISGGRRSGLHDYEGVYDLVLMQ